MKALLLIISFFTRLPIGHLIPYSEALYQKSIKYFPFVGLIIGVFLLGPAMLLAEHEELKALATILTYLWISGGIHLDGLADSADGLLSGRPKARMLEIMKDSHIGAFGVISLILYFLFFFVLGKATSPLALFWMPAVGKTMGFLSASVSDYAREDQGMGYVFIKHITKKQALPYGAGLLLCSYGLLGLVGGIAVAATGLFSYGLTRKVHQKIDGMTGDTIGMVIETGQMCFLLSLAILQIVF